MTWKSLATMLTSHHYLLGSLFAAFCTLGIASQEAYLQSAYHPRTPTASATNYPGQQSWSQASAELSAQTENQDESSSISHRGSGRIDEEPADSRSGNFATENYTNGSVAIAHRGSGRSLPTFS